MNKLLLLSILSSLFLFACSHQGVESWESADLDAEYEQDYAYEGGELNEQLEGEDELVAEDTKEASDELLASGEQSTEEAVPEENDQSQVASQEGGPEEQVASLYTEEENSDVLAINAEESELEEDNPVLSESEIKEIEFELAKNDAQEPSEEPETFATSELEAEGTDIASNEKPQEDVEVSDQEDMKLEPIETLASNELKEVKKPEETFQARPNQLPPVASMSVSKEGSNLNRYFVLRQEHNPESVSQILFGTPDRSKELVAWNQGTWRAGRVIYYQSAEEPDEGSVKSYYQARNITPESYTVQKGDWLSTIAQSKYGDVRSWTELALINHLETPDQIAPGQTLALNPVHFPDANQLMQQPPQQLAKNEDIHTPLDEATELSKEINESMEKAAEQAPLVASALEPAPVMAEPREESLMGADPAIERTAQSEPVKKEEKKEGLASLEIVQFIQRNVTNILIALLLGICAGTGYYFMTAKGGDDF